MSGQVALLVPPLVFSRAWGGLMSFPLVPSSLEFFLFLVAEGSWILGSTGEMNAYSGDLRESLVFRDDGCFAGR